MHPTATTKFTSADLLLMPDDGKHYEVIEGELYVSRQPHWHHQFACGQLFRFLQEWSERNGSGVANGAPGVIFAEDDDVAQNQLLLFFLSQYLDIILACFIIQPRLCDIGGACAYYSFQ